MTEERVDYTTTVRTTIEAIRGKDSLLDMLRSLRNQTNAILFDWHKFGDLPKDQPVNWATVLCCSASAGIDSIGASFLSVVVESASPDADKFQAWLSDKLAETGWPGIYVITEW